MKGNKDISRARMQSLETLGHMAGGIAHDFNSILSIIEGHTELAVRRLKEGTLRPEQLQKIIRSTKQGAGLTRQLLSFGMPALEGAGKTDIAAALREQHALLYPLMGEGIRFLMTVPEEPLWVQASQDNLLQIILNLCLNAKDAMPGGGELTVFCTPCQQRQIPSALREKYPETGFVRLSVIDTGEGMPESLVPRIFEPFFTTKGKAKGTGLGLSIVYTLAERLQGGVEVSSAPGEGTSFDVYLPLASAPSIEIAGIAFRTSLADKTVLLVDDDTEQRELAAGILQRMHMRVISARDGNHALVLQEDYAGEIDFLLTDVVMPGIDGIRLAEMFRALRPDSRIIYMSSYPFMRNGRTLAEDAFISKPLREDRIRKAMERALERKKGE